MEKEKEHISVTIDREIFGSRIREMRESEGFTRTQMELICGISKNTLRGIESGKHYPSFAALRSLLTEERFIKYSIWLLCDLADDESPSDFHQITPKEKLASELISTKAKIETKAIKSRPKSEKNNLAYKLLDMDGDKTEKLLEYLAFLEAKEDQPPF